MRSIRLHMQLLACLGVFAVSLFFISAAHGAEPVYRVKIPVQDGTVTNDNLATQFARFTEAYVAEVNGEKNVFLGEYLRRQDAKSLLEVVKTEHPLARVVATEKTLSLNPIPHQFSFTLEDLGYDKDLIAYGEQPYVRLDFPWEPALRMQDGVLHLFLRLSPHLRLKSTLTVRVEGMILHTIRIAPGQEVARVEIPLAPLEEMLGKSELRTSLKVVLEGSFRIFDDPCVNARSSDTWFILQKKSRLAVSKTRHTFGLNYFLTGAYKEMLIAADYQDMDTARAALQVAAAVKAASPHVQVRHAHAPAVSESGRSIILGPFEQDLRMQGATLYVNLTGAEAVGNEALSLMAANRADVIKMKPTQWTEKSLPIPLAALGWETSTVTGGGDLVMPVPFTLHQIGGLPDSLSVTLNFVNSAIPPEDIGIIKVRLNGVLAGSLALSHDPQTDRQLATISLPVDELNQRNQLDVVFAYYFEQGDCRGSFPHLEATLYNDSFLTLQGHDRDRLLKLNSVFGQLRGSGAMVVPDMNETTLAPLVEWAALYGEINQSIPEIALLREMPRNKDFDYLVLSLGDGAIPDGLTPLVDTTHDVVIRNPLTNEVPFQASLGSSTWFVQTFRHKGMPTFLVSSLRPAPEKGPALSLKILESFDGNVAAGRDGLWRSMDIGRQLKVVSPDKPGMGYYWSKYKLFIVLVMAGLLLLFFIYAFKNLTRNK